MRWMCVLLVGCGVKFGDGGGGGSTSAPKPSDASAEASITGVGCGQDLQTHAKLCSGVSACPGLLVDPDQFPGCGFVPGTMNISCLCTDVLCPMGTPKTCDEAAKLLDSSNVLLVCSQASEQICKPVAH